MAKNAVIIGPWGCLAPQNRWTYEPQGAISHISITHSDAIYSIRFTSEDEKGKIENSRKFGSATGSGKAEVDIDIKNGERLNSISGTSDHKSGYVVVTSLTFGTNKERILGPFGTIKGTAFSFHVPDQSFSGFHGRSGSWLDAIGVYLPPEIKVRVGRWGAQDPGNEWDYEPKGAISHISITHDDAIYSISFTSQDEQGTVDRSKIFGAASGSKADEIDIDVKKEKLNYISGTYGIKSGNVVITSLSFSTNQKKVFGPFGTATGTAFSLLVKDIGFSGFHGRAHSCLDAIGVYVGTKITKDHDVGLRNCYGRKKSCWFCSIIILVLLICAVGWLLVPSHKKKAFLELLDHVAAQTDFSLPVEYGILNGFRGRFKQ